MTIKLSNGVVDDLTAALKPFAAVAEHDIGSDEHDSDKFQPARAHNRAPMITVGDLRRALAVTHSHGTSTLAMSDETVPSEEFVLVPREPTHEMLNHAQDVVKAGDGMSWNGRSPQMMLAEAWRAMIAAAPVLSASHLAKEGGEVWAAEPIGSFNEWFLSLPLERQAILRDDKWMLAEAAWAAGQLLPQPSPALAKGGDAVREALVEPLKWARTTDPSEGSVHYGTGVFGHWYAASRVKPKVWSVNHHIDGKNVIVGLFESLQSAYAAAQSDYDCRIRAALSTPTEGPASQTEGMGRDATKLRENIEAFLEMHRRGVLTPRTPNIPIELLQKALAALTQPETAEAVPPLYLIRKGGAFYRPNSQGYTRSIAEAGRYSLAEAEAITHPNGPNGPRDGMDYIPAPALASDPAPATDDRERLLEALRKIAETRWDAGALDAVLTMIQADARAALATEASR